MTADSRPLGLSRDGNHVYCWKTPVEVRMPIPSVTTVDTLDKSGPLVGWAKRTVAEIAVHKHEVVGELIATGGEQAAINWLKGLPDYQRDTSADLGTSVHLIAEKVIRGQPVEMTTAIEPYVNSYRAWLEEWKPAFVAVEQMVCSLTYDYAGTFDSIAVIDGQVWMLDIKSGSGVYDTVALQMVAYARAEFIGRPGEAVKYRIPAVERFGVVHVRPEGARLIPVMEEPGAADAAFAAFQHSRAIYGWQKTWAKTVIGDALVKEGAVA